MTLLDAISGSEYTVTGTEDGIPHIAIELGLRAGALVRVLSRFPLGGPLVVDVDGSVVAISRRLARRVNVRSGGAKLGV